MTFKEWFYNAPHRAQYTKNHPTYSVAEEAWIAAHEACAKVCDVLAVHPEYASDITKVAAQAIRARGDR